MLMNQVREVMTVNQEMTVESSWIWLTSEQMGFPLRSEFVNENHGEAGSSKQCNDQREFPAQNGKCFENARNRSHSLDDRTHGCPILPQPEGTKCASQDRATQWCDFPRIMAGKTIFLYLRPLHRGHLTEVGQIPRIHRAWQALGIIILNTSTRCYTTTRRNNNPVRSRPRRQRRFKNNHGHKDEQTSRFRPSSA